MASMSGGRGSGARPGSPEQMAGADFTERLANAVGGKANASTAYGEPVERDGVTVIPVVRTFWGFGGGGGDQGDRQGSGGGGASLVWPLGHIEIRDGHAEFKPLHHPRLAVLVLAAAVVALLIRVLKS
jgi:uncharacterized spore protein YtfJ